MSKKELTKYNTSKVKQLGKNQSKITSLALRNEVALTNRDISLKKVGYKKPIDVEIEDIINKELNDGIKKTISKIHPDINFRYNSLNILIGNQGSSKTTSVMKELMRLAHYPNDYHLLIYVSPNEQDISFDKLCKYINLPVIKMSLEEIEESFEDLIKVKTLYNKMVDGEIEEDYSILPSLFVDDFSRKRLHTIILFDDASFIFDKKSKSKFKTYFTTLRHSNVTVFCCLQIWGSMDPSIKSQISSVFVFKGFSRERVGYIFRQIPIDLSFEEFWSKYIKLKKYQKLIVDCRDCTLKIV